MLDHACLCNLDFGIPPPLGGLCNNMRGRSMNIHPFSSRTTSRLRQPARISSKAVLMATLCGSTRRNLGTLHHASPFRMDLNLLSICCTHQPERNFIIGFTVDELLVHFQLPLLSLNMRDWWTLVHLTSTDLVCQLDAHRGPSGSNVSTALRPVPTCWFLGRCLETPRSCPCWRTCIRAPTLPLWWIPASGASSPMVPQQHRAAATSPRERLALPAIGWPSVASWWSEQLPCPALPLFILITTALVRNNVVTSTSSKLINAFAQNLRWKDVFNERDVFLNLHWGCTLHDLAENSASDWSSLLTTTEPPSSRSSKAATLSPESPSELSCNGQKPVRCLHTSSVPLTVLDRLWSGINWL